MASIESLLSDQLTALGALGALTPDAQPVSYVGNPAFLIAAGPCRVTRLKGQNYTASLRFVQVFDLSAAPTGGETPRYSFPLPGNNGGGYPMEAYEEWPNGLDCPLGVAVAVSSTESVYTPVADGVLPKVVATLV